MSVRTLLSRILFVGAGLVGLGACTADAYPPTVGGYATVYADGVPPDIYAYPRVYYRGDYAYLVGQRWYYPSHKGWVVLRSEPPELYRYRVSSQPVYRPARPYAPPAPFSYPPPATRVR